MTTPDDLLRVYRDATEPGEDSLSRVRERLRLEREPEAARALLRELPDPDASAIARVLARLRASIAAGESVRMPLGNGPLWAGGLAAAVLALGLLLGPEVAPEPPPVMIAANLEAVEDARVEPAPGVALDYTGWGFVSGSERQPRIHFGAGSLHVDVEPNQGIDLVIETPNGVVSVVGTVFDVVVDDLGTRVSVERGAVKVACELGDSSLLRAGESTRCVRASASTLNMLAVKSVLAGNHPERVLSLVDRALDLQPVPEVEEQLLLRRFHTLASLGRTSDLGAAADAWLAHPLATETDEVRSETARLALQAGDCATALPHLEVLAAAPDADPALVSFRERCRAVVGE